MIPTSAPRSATRPIAARCFAVLPLRCSVDTDDPPGRDLSQRRQTDGQCARRLGVVDKDTEFLPAFHPLQAAGDVFERFQTTHDGRQVQTHDQADGSGGQATVDELVANRARPHRYAFLSGHHEKGLFAGETFQDLGLQLCRWCMPTVINGTSSRFGDSAASRIVGIDDRKTARFQVFEQSAVLLGGSFRRCRADRGGRVRTLVSTAASNATPAICREASASLDTSTTPCEQPLITMRDSQRASSGGGGVAGPAGAVVSPSQ